MVHQIKMFLLVHWKGIKSSKEDFDVRDAFGKKLILWHHVKDSRYPDMNSNPLENDKESSKEDFSGRDTFEK